MIFITGPLYSGKRTFAAALPGSRLADVQDLAPAAEDLAALADRLCREYDIYRQQYCGCVFSMPKPQE